MIINNNTDNDNENNNDQIMIMMTMKIMVRIDNNIHESDNLVRFSRLTLLALQY